MKILRNCNIHILCPPLRLFDSNVYFLWIAVQGKHNIPVIEQVFEKADAEQASLGESSAAGKRMNLAW